MKKPRVAARRRNAKPLARLKADLCEFRGHLRKGIDIKALAREGRR